MTEIDSPALLLQLEYTHIPQVLDLSGQHPFDAVLKIRRAVSDKDPRPVTIRTATSIFDPYYALLNGAFDLTEHGNDTKKIVPPQSRNESNTGPAFITLPSRANDRRPQKFDYDVSIPFRIATYLTGQLSSGKRYTLKPTTKTLGVPWWCYGGEPDHSSELPSSEPKQPSINRVTGTADFQVVESLPTPPPVTVSVSLSSPTVHLASDSPHQTLCIITTNRGDRPITLQKKGEQHYIRPRPSGVPGPSPLPWHSIVATKPSLDSFHLARTPDGEDCIRLKSANVQYLGGGSGGWSRETFVTLEPGQPLVREVPFLDNLPGVVRRMGDEDGEFRLWMRDAGMWWCEGSVEDIFGAESHVQSLPNREALPLVPKAENEVVFRLEQ